jgi:hypothetical protein
VDDYYLGIIGWLLLICLFSSVRMRALMKMGSSQGEQSKAQDQDPAANPAG